MESAVDSISARLCTRFKWSESRFTTRFISWFPASYSQFLPWAASSFMLKVESALDSSQQFYCPWLCSSSWFRHSYQSPLMVFLCWEYFFKAQWSWSPWFSSRIFLLNGFITERDPLRGGYKVFAGFVEDGKVKRRLKATTRPLWNRLRPWRALKWWNQTEARQYRMHMRRKRSEKPTRGKRCQSKWTACFFSSSWSFP